MRGKKKGNIGLSIGPRKIALAEVHTEETGVVVDRVGIADTPEDALEAGRVADPEALSRAIRELMVSTDTVKINQVSLAITDEGSVTRMLEMPPMSRGETLEALLSEVENYAALAGSHPVIDFQTPEGETVGQPVEVLFVAAAKDSVDSYLSAVEAINLRASAMETKPLAALRAVTNLPGNLPETQPDQPFMLVTIEENVGMIIIVRDKTVRFIHDMEIGTGNLQSERDFRETVRELRSSVDYYHNTFTDEGRIENIVLLTDGSEGVDAREILERLLGLPVAEPGAASGDAEVASHPLSAYAAIGAATREAIRDDSSVNLLSTGRPWVASLRKRVVLLCVMVMFLAFLATGARVYVGMKADDVERDLITLQEQQKRVEAEAVTQIPVIQAGIESLKAQTEITDAAMKSVRWGDHAKLMEEVRSIIPKDVWLTSLSWSGNSVSFSGYGLSPDATWESVFRFRRALWAAPYFDPVDLNSISDAQIGGYPVARFQIQCGVIRDKLEEE
jgi:Tfp pilus assembly protein PilN